MNANWKLVSEKVIKKFGRREAEAYLALPQLDGERDIRASHVAHLAREYEDGEFLTGHIATVTIGKSRDRCKLNGGHQCTMLVERGNGATMSALVQDFWAATGRDAARLYEKFDNPISMRGWYHIIKMYHATCKGAADWPIRVYSLCTGAVGFDRGKCSRGYKKTIKRADRAEYATLMPVECGIMAEIVAVTGKSGHITREPVFNAMLQTILHDQSQAQGFWAKVRDGEMLPSGHPAMVLRNKLMSVNSGSGGSVTSGRKRGVSHDERYTWCIRAWNAFREDRGVMILRYRKNAPLPAAQ